MKKQILFVDDERNVLEGLRRMLRGMRHEWEMEFTESGLEALAIMARKPFDVVVSDMRMPGLDGSQLLARVKELHPHMVRIILSGYSDLEMILKTVNVAHQYLAKPCEPDMIKGIIARTLALRELMTNETLAGVVSSIETLPSAPSIYQEVIQELSSPDASIQKVSEIIARDPSMTAKILHLANSAFFGLYQRVNNLERALALLGFDTIVALVISVQIFSSVSSPHLSIPALWDHSIKTAFFARTIAEAENQSRHVIDDAFMGGLLHDVGRLLLTASLPETYEQVMSLAARTGDPVRNAEKEILGTTHAEVGAYLLGLWGLPDQIVEAVAFHHSPNRCPAPSFTPLTAVHVGNALARADLADDGGNPKDLLDLEHLTRLGRKERLASWEAGCRKPAHQGALNG